MIRGRYGVRARVLAESRNDHKTPIFANKASRTCVWVLAWPSKG